MSWWKQFRHKFHHWHEAHGLVWDETSRALGCGGGGEVLRLQEQCCVCEKWQVRFVRRSGRAMFLDDAVLPCPTCGAEPWTFIDGDCGECNPPVGELK